MREKWSEIAEFPRYHISNFGTVMNGDSGKIISQSTTRSGLVKVGLMLNNVQYTRSVALLVADAFVSGRNDIFNTPIHLNGDQTNNTSENLTWRPRWFALMHHGQFEIEEYQTTKPIMDVKTKHWYFGFHDAAMQHGLLLKDIRRSIWREIPCFPTRQIFTF